MNINIKTICQYIYMPEGPEVWMLSKMINGFYLNS